MAERDAQLERHFMRNSAQEPVAWSAQRIEQIVRDVMARLDGPPPAMHKPACASETSGQTDVQDNGRHHGRLMLADRLVTLSVLEGRLEGVVEIHVPEEAIVTPAARDALREQGIRLDRNAKQNNEKQTQAIGVTVGVAACTADPIAAARLPQVLRRPVEHLARTGLVNVVEEMVANVALGGSKGLLFTDETAAAICLANRRSGVRAVTARDVNEAERASASVGANMLSIAPSGISTWQQLQIARSFVECRVTYCPDKYRATLG